VKFSKKVFNVILAKEEQPPLQKNVAWLIEPTIAPAPIAIHQRFFFKNIFLATMNRGRVRHI
jgi:hypothetical protein